MSETSPSAGVNVGGVRHLCRVASRPSSVSRASTRYDRPRLFRDIRPERRMSAAAVSRHRDRRTRSARLHPSWPPGQSDAGARGIARHNFCGVVMEACVRQRCVLQSHTVGQAPCSNKGSSGETPELATAPYRLRRGEASRGLWPIPAAPAVADCYRRCSHRRLGHPVRKHPRSPEYQPSTPASRWARRCS